MEQSQKRLRQIAAGAVALVLVAVSGWFVLHFGRLEERDISELAVARYRLPGRNSVAKYQWVSPHEVIVGAYAASPVDNKVNPVLWEFDLLSGGRSELVGVNQLLKDFKQSESRYIDWSIADKALVICRARAIVVADLSGRVLSATGMICGIRVVSAPIWLPDRQEWVVAGFTNNVTAGWVWEGGQEGARMILHTNVAFAMGVAGGSEIAFLEEPLTKVRDLRLVYISSGSETSTRSREIGLPFQCEVFGASLSPSGKRILWELGRTVGFPKPGLSGTFPFVTFTKKVWEYSVWVSNSDGSRFVCLGCTSRGPSGYSFQWHPDDRRISLVADGELLLLEIPK